jgi:hypothetical protein
MTTPQSLPSIATGGRRGRGLRFVAALVASLFTASVIAQAPAAAPTGVTAPAPEEQLETLVGRIALYPDDLVAIILPASTNPLQLVQADRFLDKRKTDPKLKLDDKWDDAVKTLLNYPDIVKMMSADLDWTSALGEVVVADQGDVLEAVQAFRRKAQAAGNLKSDDKQVVKTEKEIIIIEPADPQVIYVPQYNPSTVVVYSATPYYWGYYPTPYPSYYYPYAPGAAFAAGVIWGAAIGAAWGGGRYGANYGGNNININRNTNINTGDINVGGGNQRPGGGGGGSSTWKSNKQPGQVSSSVGKANQSARAGDSRGSGGTGAGGGARPSQGATGGAAGAGGGARPSQGTTGGGAGAGGSARPSQGATGAGGGASASTNRSGGSGDSAFGSAGSSGRQATSNSSRGASSRSSSSASSRSSGGASRGGGGGGGGRRR